MSTFAQKPCWPYRFTVLLQLVTIVQALTLPVNNCGNSQILRNATSDHKAATNCAPNILTNNSPSNTLSTSSSTGLSFPPEPFLYRINFTPYIIKYTNYGSPIPESDAIELLSTAQEEILYEMERLPDHIDIAIATTRIWAETSARLRIKPTPMMRHSTCGLILAGMMECGDEHGFVEADMQFLSVEDVFHPFGNGSLVLDE